MVAIVSASRVIGGDLRCVGRRVRASGPYPLDRARAIQCGLSTVSFRLRIARGRCFVAGGDSSATRGGGMSTKRALQILVPVDLLVLALTFLSAVRPDWVIAGLDFLYQRD